MGPGFAGLDLGFAVVPEQDQFLMVSQQMDGLPQCYGPRARLLNLSDRMEQEMGRLSAPVAAWGNSNALRKAY